MLVGLPFVGIAGYFTHPFPSPDPNPVAGQVDEHRQWPNAEMPNVRPYHGVRIPDDTLSSLQWARPVPESEYLSPVEVLHGPVPVDPVPPIAPPPGALRFGDVQADAPEWLPRQQAIQLNDGAAGAAPFALVGAGVGDALGLVIGALFAPIGLAAAPVGAAYGAALMAAPLAAIGAGI